MPKPLMMTIAVEEAFFGKVFRALDSMPGVASIMPHSELKTGKENGKASPQKKGGTQSVYCLILGALNFTSGQSRAQLLPIIESNGKKASSMPDALAKLHKAKHITKRGKGRDVTYWITNSGKRHFATACQIEEGAE